MEIERVPSFPQCIAKAFVEQHRGLETGDSQAWKALASYVESPASHKGPEYDPVARLLEASRETLKATGELESQAPSYLHRESPAPTTEADSGLSSKQLTASLFRRRGNGGQPETLPRLVASPGVVRPFLTPRRKFRQEACRDLALSDLFTREPIPIRGPLPWMRPLRRCKPLLSIWLPRTTRRHKNGEN